MMHVMQTSNKRTLLRKFAADQRRKLRRWPNRVVYRTAGQYILLNDECSFSIQLLSVLHGSNVARIKKKNSALLVPYIK